MVDLDSVDYFTIFDGDDDLYTDLGECVDDWVGNSSPNDYAPGDKITVEVRLYSKSKDEPTMCDWVGDIAVEIIYPEEDTFNMDVKYKVLDVSPRSQ
jgi:hypothetical protein